MNRKDCRQYIHPGNRPLLLLIVFLLAIDMGRAAEPFDYFQNSWSVISLKDYNRGTRITPDNELLLSDQNKVQIRFGRQLTALSRKQTKALLQGWLPVVLLSARDGMVRYDIKFWASPLPSVKDWQKAFDWPVETDNYLNWIYITATNTGSAPAEAKLSVSQSNAPETKPYQFVRTLPAGDSVRAVVRIPFLPIADNASQFTDEDPELWLNRTVQYWQGLIAKGARIKVPCEKATYALLAAHVCQFIANDHGVVHGGEGFYDRFYIRDGAYQLMQLEEAGFLEAARKAIEVYLGYQRPDGRFESQVKQFDANGQACWAIWQYYKITGDRLFLEKAYPQMLKAVEWTKKVRRQEPADSPFFGVLPNTVADGEFLWKGDKHIVGYDFWNLRGLLCTLDAAAILGKGHRQITKLQREAESYRAAINKAWKNTGKPYFPPSWETDGTHWGNTEILWPTELFEPGDLRVTVLINEVRRNHGGGFTEGTIRWTGHAKKAIHPYMSSYTTMASLARGEHEQVVEDFYWYLLHSTATHAFPEGIYYEQRLAWHDTIPHGTGASNYAIMLRHMLLHERGDELHLLCAVPDWWLAPGNEIIVEQAPTHFGKVSFRVHGTAQGVQIYLEPPMRKFPRRIILHLPESRPLYGNIQHIDEIVFRSVQKKRWDFAAVVNLYQQQVKQ